MYGLINDTPSLIKRYIKMPDSSTSEDIERLDSGPEIMQIIWIVS
jgi:hypothetical protein